MIFPVGEWRRDDSLFGNGSQYLTGFVPSIFTATIDGAVQATAGEANADFVAGLDGIAAREGFALGVVGKRVAALQDVERA